MASRSVAQSSESTLSSAILVPEDDAGLGFYLDVAQRRALVFGKAVDIVLGEADVVEVAGRQLRHRRLDIALGQPELGR